MQEAPETNPTSPSQGRETTCEICDKPIVAKRSSKKYCSVDCRAIGAHIKKQSVENLIVLVGQRLIRDANPKLDKDFVTGKIKELCKGWIAEAEQLRGKMAEEQLA